MRNIFQEMQKRSGIMLFTLILLIGIFSRTWDYMDLPPGLHQDEASIGVDAYYLLHYGVDRNGVSYPVHLISWGSGQNALYAYILMPFIWAFGLTPFAIRLPMLIMGILTLPIVYLIGKRIWSVKYGLTAMFFIAISPWHILMSRWGLEANVLPFIFSPIFFLPSLVFFAFTLYAYGPAYAGVPVFLGMAVLIVLIAKWINFKTLFVGLVIFSILALPIALFVVVNTWKLDSIHLGAVTIPRLPAQPRYEMLGAFFSTKNPQKKIMSNAPVFFDFLISQTDFRTRNIVEPYGYFYKYSFPFEALGALVLMPIYKKSQKVMERLLLLAWLLASVIVGLVQPVYSVRVNIIFIPLILSLAYLLVCVSDYIKPLYLVITPILLITFIFFTRAYHGSAYREIVGREFYTGLLDAVKYVQVHDGNRSVCTPGVSTNEPYIFFLFQDPIPPQEFLAKVKYDDPGSPFREASILGHYYFSINNCPTTPETIYLLFHEEPIPFDVKNYLARSFGNYVVYLPKQP